MFQMFKRNARNNCNEISDAEANIIASRTLRIWLRRIACAMAKTKAMCIINYIIFDKITSFLRFFL